MAVLGLLLAPAAIAQSGDRLVVEGINDALRDNVLAYLSLDEQPCDAPEWQLRRRFRDADARIIEAMSALGYYRPVIEKSLTIGDDCWSATLRIDAGPRVKYASFDAAVDGDAASDPSIAGVLASAPKKGDALHHGRYEAFKKRLGQALASRGYAEWRFEAARLDVFPDENRAEATLSVVSGPRYRFGDITIEQSDFDPDLVRRFVRLTPGEPFSRDVLTRLQRDLSGSALFDRVLVTEQREGGGDADDDDRVADQRIPVTVRMTGAEKLGYFVGVGASTDRGPRLRAGYSNRRVNPRGHQFSADMQLSPVQSQFNARYRQPLKRPLVEWQSYELRLEDENTDTFDSRSAKFGIERTRALGGDWILAYGVQLGRTDFTVGQVTDISTLLMPVVGFDRRNADSDSNPRRGSATEVRIRAASSALLSTTDFFQVYARHRRLFAIGESGRLSLRAELGTTWKQDIDELPPSIRFFAGGDSSVRGYGFQTLGPTDENGEVVGGSRLATASIEYEHTIRGNWGAAVFADSGNAFNGSNYETRTGVGFGIVWRSPVGPLRAYLAHPLDADRNVRLHVSFGADL